MEIQPFAPQTSFDTSSAGAPANGPKDDLFSQMMDQAASRAAERRAQTDKPDRDTLDRGKPEAKPHAAEPRRWQPPHPAAHPAVAKPPADHTPPRSPRADEAHAANDARKDAAPARAPERPEDKAAKPASKDEAPAKPAEPTAKAATPAKTERGDTAQKAAKPEQAPKTEAAGAADADETTDTTDSADSAETGGSDTPADAPVEVAAVTVDQTAILDSLVVVDAEATVAETTVQLVAAAEPALAAAVTGSAEVSAATADPTADLTVEPGAAPVAAPVGDPTTAPMANPTTAPATPTASNTPTADTPTADTKAPDQATLAEALATAAAGLQAGVGAPAQPPQPGQDDSQAPQATDAVAGVPPASAPAPLTGAPVAPADALPAAELAAAATLADAKAAAAPSEAVPSDAKAEAAPADPKSAAKAEATPDAKPAKTAAPKADDEEFKLPDSLADLVGAKPTEKAAGKPAAKGHAEAGKNGDTAQQPSATAPAPAPAQPQRATGDTIVAAAEGMAVDGIAAAAPASAAAEAPGNKDPGTGHILPTDTVKTAAPADAPPAFTTLRPARGPNAPMGVPEQVAVNIHKHVAEGNERFTIMLRPEELGRIDIRLEIAKDGRVSAVVAVDKPQTLELLQRDSRGLERALQDAGLKADSDSLSFSLRGDGASSFADQRGDDQRGTGRRGRGFGGGDADAPEVAAMQTIYLAPGRVDVRV